MVKNKLKNFGMAIFIFILIFLLLIIFYPIKYDDIIAEKHLGCSLKHPLGTDYLGRDFFIRICFAILNTIMISICSIFCSLGIGVLYGTYTGYKGGKIEKLMRMILNIIECIPDFLLAIIILIIFNNLFINSSLIGIFITLVIVSWTQMARIIVNETKKIMNNDYIQYSKIKNANFIHILKFHLLPNLKDVIIVTAIQRIPSAIFLESFLSFVGIGIQPPYPSLGKMISEGIKVFRIYTSELLIPSIVLMIIVFIFNIFGESIIKKDDFGEEYGK